MSASPIKLLLVDDDPIFGLGFRTALSTPEFADLQVVLQVFSLNEAMESERLNEINIIILDPSLETNSSGVSAILKFVEDINSLYPHVSLFLLTAFADYQDLLAAQEAGIQGYCAKKTPIAMVAAALRQVYRGEIYWQGLTSRAITKKTTKKSWLSQQSYFGLKYIDDNLDLIKEQLARENLSSFDWLYWKGRKRELLLVRWLVSQLSPTEIVIFEQQPPAYNTPIAALSPENNYSLATVAPSTIFEIILNKIQGGLENYTGNFLEIDILPLNKRQELFYIVVKEIAKVQQENKFYQLDSNEIQSKIEQMLREIWLESTLSFLRKNYSITAFNSESKRVDLIWGEYLNIRQHNFSKLPYQEELFTYLIKEEKFHKSTEEKERLETLVENLLIHMSDAVMEVILNNFCEIEDIRRMIIQKQSSREIAKLRNRISGRYRLEKYWYEPKDIFEDRYRVYYLDGTGIRKGYISGDRQKELKQLQGFRWIVTMAIEARDALAPGLKATIDFSGRGVIYLLTEIIGKALGLIARGIIQGIGNTLEELRYQKKR